MLSTEQAARMLGVGTSTLSRWRKRGEGPPFQRRGLGRVVYDEGALRVWAKLEGIQIFDVKGDNNAKPTQ